jgi:hypothetical protein
MYWAASCGGCEIAVLNIHEKILDVDANFDVVFWPVAMDAKYKDVEAMEDGSILLTLFNGGIRNDENDILPAASPKSQILVVTARANRLHPGLASAIREIVHRLNNTIPITRTRSPRPHSMSLKARFIPMILPSENPRPVDVTIHAGLPA